MKTSSSIVTPSQTKVWLDILQFRPTFAFFWISTNAPIFVPSPTSHPYRLMNFESLTSLPSLTSDAMQQYSFIARLLSPAPSKTARQTRVAGQRADQLFRH